MEDVATSKPKKYAEGYGNHIVCLVSRSQTQPSATRREGSGQPTVLAFVKSLARFLAILVGDKPLIIFIIKISISITILSQ